MKLVILATENSSTWWIANELIKDYPSLQIVIEKPISRFYLFKRRIIKLGMLKVIGQICFMLYLPILKAMSKVYIQKIIDQAGLSSFPAKNFSVKYFESVNSDACISWLIDQSPKVVVLNGTRIISQAVLSSCNAIFFNLHCGITPAYRGVHGGYWALTCGDKANIGVTVHVVDAGIDTGNIVFQETIKIDINDNFLTYPIKQYIAGIPLMLRAIQDVKSGLLVTYRRDDLKSEIYYHPTLYQYIRTLLLKDIW